MLLATPSLSWVPIVPPNVPRSYLRARVLLLHRSLRTFDRTSLPHSHLRHLCMPTHFLFVVLASSFYIILSFFVAPSCVLPRRCSGLSALTFAPSSLCNVLRFAHSDFSYLYSVSSSLRYFRVFQWSCLRLFARTRLYTQNRMSVSLSFAHLAVLQPLVLVFPLGLFPSPIILLFLFALPLLSPLFLPSILFYFFFPLSVSISPFRPFFSSLSFTSVLYSSSFHAFFSTYCCAQTGVAFSFKRRSSCPSRLAYVLQFFSCHAVHPLFYTAFFLFSLCFFSKNYHLPSISQVRLKWIFLRFAYFLLQLLAFHL